MNGAFSAIWAEWFVAFGKAINNNNSQHVHLSIFELRRTAFRYTSAPVLLSVMGDFAECERALIRERQREGIALAKQRGVVTAPSGSVMPRWLRLWGCQLLQLSAPCGR